MKLCDISYTGFLALCESPLELGQEIEIDLPHGETRLARVVWAGTSLYGCTFVGTVSKATISATVLKSEIERVWQDEHSEARDASQVLAELWGEEEQIDRLPGFYRLAIIVGAAGFCWLPVLGLAYLLLS